MYARLGPRGSMATLSAVVLRGTVEMLSAPERVKVSHRYALSTLIPAYPSLLAGGGPNITHAGRKWLAHESPRTTQRPSLTIGRRKGSPRTLVLKDLGL